mmetsp:Transcript_12505/g.30791  ORF Transcript_12505/g.30791 Transcript_12505/m.30791 type:complete len:82 (+) Transcript_12505:676-921(+)
MLPFIVVLEMSELITTTVARVVTAYLMGIAFYAFPKIISDKKHADLPFVRLTANFANTAETFILRISGVVGTLLLAQAVGS